MGETSNKTLLTKTVDYGPLHGDLWVRNVSILLISKVHFVAVDFLYCFSASISLIFFSNLYYFLLLTLSLIFSFSSFKVKTNVTDVRPLLF